MFCKPYPMSLRKNLDTFFEPCYNAVMATRYEVGRSFEYRVKNHFKDAGYVVIRSAGSKTATDLVAFDGMSILLVQCTTNKACKNEKDRVELLEMAVNRHMIPVMVWKDGYRGPLVFERIDDGPLPWETE